eukprot:TRINITY_DN3481_c0_g1_i1.p2 TRINITY_DN3481_c0_g1~~TRINITY_DN3481_c0_g1_i1.p2  ORF type:complete len:118 (+),score=23.22 TRINITY_DN3481_c0_g1_i1:62-415(+)
MQTVEEEARSLLIQIFTEQNKPQDSLQKRLEEISRSIKKTGTYHLSYDELKYATQLAWRNNSQCIGKVHWKNLNVYDCRALETEEEMFEAICNHTRQALNGGKVINAVTHFRPRSPG